MITTTFNVAKYRKDQRMTQKELADKLNVHQSMISQIETGERNPSLRLLFKMANLFGVSIDELVNEEAG